MRILAMLRLHAQQRAALLLVGDLVATGAALVSAYGVRFGTGLFEPPKPWLPQRYLEALPPALLLCIATYAAIGTYRPPGRAGSRREDLRSAVRGVLAAALLLAAGALFYRDRYQFSRGVLFLFPVLGIPLVWTARRLASRIQGVLLARGVGTRRALLAGAGSLRDDLEREILARPWMGVRIVGRPEAAGELAAAIRESGADQVFLAYPADRPAELAEALGALEDEMVDVRIVPDLPPASGLNREVGLLGDLAVVSLRQTPFVGVNRAAKRCFDVLVTGLLLVTLSPLILLVSLAVLLASGRPVLFFQERMGLDGKRFRIIKFRTMEVGAEEETGAVWAREGDPRRTAVGRILRRLSLDELPQLVNVLIGDMSLVGPRPERPVFIEEFRTRLPRYLHRLRIPAGLTGWAQVHGCRGDTDLGDRLRFDLAYLERWSLLLDAEILLRTVWQVLVGKNAA